MEVVNSSQDVGFTKCRIIPAIYWITHVDGLGRYHVFTIDKRYNLVETLFSVSKSQCGFVNSTPKTMEVWPVGNIGK